MKLELSSLEKALDSLKRVLLLEKDDVVRDSAIQRFKYTYELSIKMLRRKLEDMAESSIEIEQMGFKPLIRTGAEKGLIDDPVAWFGFREKRNITSHTYDEEKAELVYAILPSFADSASFVLNALKERNRLED